VIINPYAFGGGSPMLTPIIWNTADKSGFITLGESDKLATNNNDANWAATRSTTSFATGGGTDLLFEVEMVGATRIFVGVMKAAATLSGFIGQDANGWGFYSLTGQRCNNNILSSYAGSFVAGDKIKVLLTAGGSLEFFKNGLSQGVAFTGLSGTFYPAVSAYDLSSGGRAT
jgi:hypothetical protein